MSDVTAEDAQRYIDANYLTLDNLAERAGVTPQRLLDLVAAHCIPPHSYAVRGAVVFASTFGEFTAPAPLRRYYHPDTVGWIEKAEALAADQSLSQVARLMREDFEQAVERALDGRAAPWARGVDHAWAFWMDGTFGLCLKELTVESLVAKECARADIAAIVRPEPDHRLNAAERAALAAAVARYDAVALPFAPHELEKSSRRLEVGAALEKYDLMRPAAR
jgi:hypothetical protein